MTHCTVCMSYNHQDVSWRKDPLSQLTLTCSQETKKRKNCGIWTTEALTFILSFSLTCEPVRLQWRLCHVKLCVWVMLKKVMKYSRSPGSYTQGPCSGSALCTGRHSAHGHSVDFQRTWKTKSWDAFQQLYILTATRSSKLKQHWALGTHPSLSHREQSQGWKSSVIKRLAKMLRVIQK